MAKPFFPPVLRPFVSVPDGALDVWNAAKVQAAAGRSQAPVVLVGDSITFGNVVTGGIQTTSFAAKVRDALFAAYGGEAGRTIDVNNSSYVPTSGSALGTSMAAGEAMWTYTAAAWTYYTGSNANTGMLGWEVATVTNNATATFTPMAALQFADFDLLIHREAGGSAFTVTVDGSSMTSDSGSGAQTCLASGAYQRHVAVPFSGLSKAAHTIVITAGASAVKLWLAGITLYPNGRTATGIVFHKLARGGVNSTILSPLWPSHLTLADNFSAFLGAKAMCEDFSPKLAICALGINDCGTSLGTGSTRYNLAQFGQSAQNAGASLAFIVPYGGSGLGNYTAWVKFVVAIHDVARAFNGVVVNVHAHFSSLPSATLASYLYSDNLHPNDAGHAAIAALVTSVLAA